MATLKQRLLDLTSAIVTKMNWLNTNKENISSKKTDLTSNVATDYPTVPAVKAGIAVAITTANNYADGLITAMPAYIPVTQKGANGGVAELDATGIILSRHLPSYVDDIVDLVAFVTTTPTSGMTAGQKRYNSTTKKIITSTSTTASTTADPEGDKIYVNVAESTIHRWSGTVMADLGGPGLVIGITSSTAGRGDHTKLAYDHTSKTDNPHNVGFSQLIDKTTADLLVNGPLTTALAGKSNDADVVKIAGTQTISGAKTFTLVPKSSQDASATTDLVRKSQFDAGLALQENKLPVAGSAGLVLTSTASNGRAWTSFPSGVTNYAELNDRITANLLVNTSLTDALALKVNSNDTTYVRTTGTQTITGQKNFTTSPTTNSNATGPNDIPRKSQMDAAIKVVQDDLGEGDTDYAAQLNTGVTF